MIYHSGELAVQARVGVQAEAESLAKGIGGAIIKPAAKDFLASQRLAIASTIDSNNRVWASLITGETGFLQAVAEQIVKIDAILTEGDPLETNLRYKNDLGLLAIDLATRRRLRVNGKAQMWGKREIYLHTQQVYFNCHQYIQKREINATPNRGESSVQISATLTPQQQQLIQQADTFFIASYHPQSGADASHRGGHPGFVQVLPDKLIFPDYSGNNMFNTLGNLVENPQAGLLFINFETGNTLQLTGKAAIAWDSKKALQFAGAKRLVEFQIESAIALSPITSLQWQFKEYSPYLPVKTKPLTD